MAKKPVFQNENGFSLIELMVVVAILGMLSTVATVNYQSMVERSRNANRIATLSGLKTIIESLRAETGSYPVAIGWISSNPNDNGEARNSPEYIPGAGLDLPHDQFESSNDCLSLPGQGSGWLPSFMYYSDGRDYKIMSHCASPEYSSRADPPRTPAGADNPCGASGSFTWAISFYSPGAKCW